MIKIIRNGYGNNFNNLYIIDTKILKESKNEYGHNKIKKEILFYKYVISNNILLNIPTIFDLNDTSYSMKYLYNYEPLYKTFKLLSIKQQNILLDNINNQLNTLHLHTQMIEYNDYIHNILLETVEKVNLRRNEILPLINKYSNIIKVNNILLNSYEIIIQNIEKKVIEYVNSKNEYIYSIIHGDCQFNNILYNKDTHDIVFIDPRGYFGDSDIYGIPEYDYAKVKFALTGYDIFDNMDIESLNILDNNIILPEISIYPLNEILHKGDIVSILTISIWLGNAHCFKDNENKAMFSYFYALYLATLYL